MKTTRQGFSTARVAAASLLAAALAAPCPAAAPPAAAPGTTGAPPLRLSSREILGYLAVPDLERLLAHVEAASNVVAPAALPPGAAREGLAQKLGVPGLEGLAARPILLVLLKGPGPMAPPRPVVFLPVKDAKAYETTIAGLGWKSRTAPGLLIASSTPEGLAASAPLEAEYRRIAGAGISHDLRVFLQAGRLMDAYGPMIQLGLDAAMAKADAGAAKAEPEAPARRGAPPRSGGPSAAAPSPAVLAKILKLEVKGFLALFRQLDDVQWDIDLQPESFDSDTVVTAKTGSALADLSGMPPAASNRAAALLSGSGFMTATYQLDPVRLGAFVGSIVKEVAADPDGAELLTPEVTALVDELSAAYGGQAAYRMAGAPGVPLAVETVMSVADEAKALAMMERGLALLGPNGAWGALLEGTGMGMTLQKGVRRHAGVPVHRLKVRVDPKGLTAQQKTTLPAFMRDTEFTITSGYYLSAQDPAALDRLIDRAASGGGGEGMTLTSARAFGEGRHMYVDYDLVGLMKAVSSLTPPVKGQPNPFADLPASADPMLTAMTFGDGRIRWQSKLPLRPFVLMQEAAKKAAPSPAPSPKAAPSPPPRRRP